jgi:hypothetical protein
MGGFTPMPMAICALAAGTKAKGTSIDVVPARSRLRIANLRAHGATFLSCHILLSSRISAFNGKLYLQYRPLAHRYLVNTDRRLQCSSLESKRKEKTNDL